MQPQSISVTATLPIPLTDKELESYSERGASLMSDLLEKEQSYKLEQQERRTELRGIRHDMEHYLKAFHEKKERREVDCDQFFDLAKKQTWYVHNGIEYNRREMTDDELAKANQGALFDDSANLQDAAAN